MSSNVSDNSGGRNLGRLPERSNFAQTCNLLSQYLKEKRNLGITPRMETKDEFQTTPQQGIMNFLTKMETQEDYSKDKGSVNGKFVGNESSARPYSAPMTIFYGGKVLVFNDLCSERAEEIMAMAGKGVSSTRSAHTVSSDKVMEQPPTAIEQLHQQTQSKVVSGDLPIARRASLHRFLEKRKDRAAARVPYQVNQEQYSGHYNADESYRMNNNEEINGNTSNRSSKKFDLNL